MRTFLGRIAVVVAVLLAGSAHVVAAQNPAAEDDDPGWGFLVAPYFLFPNMNGQTTVRGNVVDVDLGPSDIFDNLDFGAMLYLEMANRDWAITLDGLYMNLGANGKTPLTERDTEVDMKQWGITATGMWRVGSWAEIGVGGRFNSLEGGLVVAPGEVALPGFDVSDTNSWFDPLIVARFTAPLESKWKLGIRGDVGGFGVGSDFTWQVFPFVGYRFSNLFEISGGYRALGMDYNTGSGDDYFLYDMVTFGPQLGLVFHF
jgi:hypothetical protein